jgi:hypothetical protein
VGKGIKPFSRPDIEYGFAINKLGIISVLPFILEKLKKVAQIVLYII